VTVSHNSDVVMGDAAANRLIIDLII